MVKRLLIWGYAVLIMSLGIVYASTQEPGTGAVLNESGEVSRVEAQRNTEPLLLAPIELPQNYVN
jgi:hypothetical protein